MALFTVVLEFAGGLLRPGSVSMQIGYQLQNGRAKQKTE
jgi:hypothetical protein